MARHRWATGERSSSPDRLDRVLNLNSAERKCEPAWTEPHYDEEPAAVDGGLAGGKAPAAEASGSDRRRSGRRWAASRRAALVAAGCTLVIGGWQFINTDRGPTEVVPIGPPAAESTQAAGGDGPARDPVAPAGEGPAALEAGQGGHDDSAGTVVVHVAGAVQAPGVVEAPAGSRVFEVLEKAGGALPEAELSVVNLAAVVEDGQQILIPRVGEALPHPGAAPAPGPQAGGGPVNLNSADASDLEELPRVGPILAGRIVEWRTQHGPFTRPEDLDAVPGIGPAMLESLLPLVTV